MQDDESMTRWWLIARSYFVLGWREKKRNGNRYDLWDFILKHDNEEEL